MDHKQRFMGWRKRMPERTRYLVDRVLERLVPEFEKHEFVWRPDYKVGVNVIPLQKMGPADWPTVEIRFIKGAIFRIEFSTLPEHCKDASGKVVQRIDANLACAPLWLFLCKDKLERVDTSVFGFPGALPALVSSPMCMLRYIRNWRQYLNSEVDAAVAMLPYLFEIFDKKTYIEWMDRPFGQINEHVFLSISQKIRRDLGENAGGHENLIEDEESDISQEPLLCALDAEIDSVNRKRDNKLLAALLLVAAGFYFGEHFTKNHERLGVVFTVFCIGFIAYTIFRTAREKQNVAVKYGLACARCGHRPDAHMVISAATSRHCAKCGARLDARIPSEHGR